MTLLYLPDVEKLATPSQPFLILVCVRPQETVRLTASLNATNNIAVLLLLLLLLLPLSDLFRARAPPYRRPVQLTVPIGGDDQLMSFAPPVLWLNTNAEAATAS